MFKRIFSILLILVMVLSFASCTSEVSAQEIINGVIESPDKITTYQFDMNIDMDMVVDSEGEVFGMAMMIESNGVVDVENKQIEMGMSTSMTITEEDDEFDIEMIMEMFVINNVLYMMADVLGEDIWIKSEMPAQNWEEMGQVEPQIELLEEAGLVELIGSEKVRGIDCYVFEIIPDMAKLWDMVMQQSELSAEGTMPDIDKDFLEEVVKSFSMKQWVAKDTYFLAKAEMEMSMELTPESLGAPEEVGTATMNIKMDLLVYDYNQPVSIVLPPEAEEALEIPINY